MRKCTLLNHICALVLISSVFLTHDAFAAFTTFNSSLEGWSSNNPSEVSWAASGGNPDGYARFEDASGGGGTFLFAPNAFLGDWSSLDGGNRIISFDHKLFDTGFIGSNGIAPYEVDISGPGGSAQWLGATPSGATDWVTVQAPIIESEWTVSGSWSAILSNVQQFKVKIELVDNDASVNRDITGLDNIRVSSVPIPATIYLFGSGLLGLIGISRRKKAA